MSIKHFLVLHLWFFAPQCPSDFSLVIFCPFNIFRFVTPQWPPPLNIFRFFTCDFFFLNTFGFLTGDLLVITSITTDVFKRQSLIVKMAQGKTNYMYHKYFILHVLQKVHENVHVYTCINWNLSKPNIFFTEVLVWLRKAFVLQRFQSIEVDFRGL